MEPGWLWGWRNCTRTDAELLAQAFCWQHAGDASGRQEDRAETARRAEGEAPYLGVLAGRAPGCSRTTSWCAAT
jgi:hypothetical protein